MGCDVSAALALAIALWAVGALVLAGVILLARETLRVRHAERLEARARAHAQAYWEQPIGDGPERRLAILKDAAQQAEEAPLRGREGGGSAP